MPDRPILPKDLPPTIDTAKRDVSKSLEMPQWVQELLKDTTPVQYFNENDDMVEKPTNERVKELIEQKKITLQKFFKQFFRGLPALVLKNADLTTPVWTNTVTKLTGAQAGIKEWVETHAHYFPEDMDGIHDRMGLSTTTQDLEAWEQQTLEQSVKELLIELWNGMSSNVQSSTPIKDKVNMFEGLANGLHGSVKTLGKTFKEIHPYPFRTKLERKEFFANIPHGEDVVLQWPPHEGEELIYLSGEPPDAPITLRVKTTGENQQELSIPIPDDLRYPEDRMSLLYQPPSMDNFPLYSQREFMFKSFEERVDDKHIQLRRIAGHNDYVVVIDTDSTEAATEGARKRTTIFLESQLGPVQWEATFEHVVWWAEQEKLNAEALRKKTRERLRSIEWSADLSRSRRREAAMASV